MARRSRLPKGWMEGSVQELLDLSDQEAAVIELRLRLATEVRARRNALGLTQRELAERMGSSQPRIAHMEQSGASVELLMRALMALGASRAEIGRLVAA